MSQSRKKALGRGLGALLATPASTPAAPVVPPAPDIAVGPAPPPHELPIARIYPNPRQPRRHFDRDKLEELAESIKEHGLLQPILVTPADDPEEYILLAGERRLRASELAGNDVIPARIVEATDAQRLEFAIIENVQRDDLNPIEEARAFDELRTSFGYGQEQIAKSIGKSRVYVSNSLRLLKLSEKSLSALETGQITAGHARALLQLSHPLQQEVLLKEILDQNLSVRAAEERARRLQEGDAEPAKKAKKSEKNPQENLDVVALEEGLTVHLGCKVRIRQTGKTKGRLEVHYGSLDDLDRVLEILGYDTETN